MTRTPNRATDSATDSLKLVTHAFDAGYVEPGIAAPKPDTDETLMISPRPRSTMPGKTASVNRITACTFRLSSCVSPSTVERRNGVFRLRPALFTNRSTGRAGSCSRVATNSRPASVPRSAMITSTGTPCSAQRLGRGGQPVGVAGHHHEFVLLGGEPPGERGTDAGRGAGD